MGFQGVFQFRNSGLGSGQLLGQLGFTGVRTAWAWGSLRSGLGKLGLQGLVFNGGLGEIFLELTELPLQLCELGIGQGVGAGLQIVDLGRESLVGLIGGGQRLLKAREFGVGLL